LNKQAPTFALNFLSASATAAAAATETTNPKIDNQKRQL